MNIYQKVSIVIALFLYFPLAWQIWRGKAEQNLATWILWGALDALSAISIFVQGGNWYLPATFTAGCVLTVVCMLRARTAAWTKFETISTLMVVLCLVGWKMSGPWLATILSTTGMVLAGLPQIKDAYKRPVEMPLSIYLGCIFVSVLSTIGGSAWTVEERLYPAACVLLCGVIALTSCRKFLRKEVDHDG
jgi:hypothetical protein